MLYLTFAPKLFAETDLQCLNDCTKQPGYLYSYCESKCSYGNDSNDDSEKKRRPQVDFGCLNDCTKKGYLYDYCEHSCSY